MRGPDGGPWGIRAADPERLMMALEDLPEEAELWKIYTTGNLGVMIDNELVGILDLADGQYYSLDEDNGG